MRFLSKLQALTLLSALLVMPTFAQIYQCEENGRKIYTDKPCNGGAIETQTSAETPSETSSAFTFTPEEENAMIMSAKSIMERLNDPAWQKRLREGEPGCWRTAEELVPVGQSISYERVVSRCVKLGDAPKATYMFIPSRIIHHCQDKKTKLEICLDKLDGHTTFKP